MSTEDPAITPEPPVPSLLARIWAHKWRTLAALAAVGIAGAWVQAQPAAKEQTRFNHFLELGLRHDRIVDSTDPTSGAGKKVLSYQYVEDRILICRSDGAIMRTLVVTADARRQVVDRKRKPSGTFDACQDIFSMHEDPEGFARSQLKAQVDAQVKATRTAE
jgi:hypothetical protein